MTKIFIIAGNYEQYKSFIHKRNHNPLLYDYVSGVDTLKGISNPTGYFIGTWHERPDIHLIIQQLMISTDIKSSGLLKARDFIHRPGH